jgi:hypothetical protein
MEFSEEAMTCEDCIRDHSSDNGLQLTADGLIKGPGKFEREPLATYHVYHVMLDGFADDDDGPNWSHICARAAAILKQIGAENA